MKFVITYRMKCERHPRRYVSWGAPMSCADFRDCVLRAPGGPLGRPVRPYLPIDVVECADETGEPVCDADMLRSDRVYVFRRRPGEARRLLVPAEIPRRAFLRPAYMGPRLAGLHGR